MYILEAIMTVVGVILTVFCAIGTIITLFIIGDETNKKTK